MLASPAPFPRSNWPYSVDLLLLQLLFLFVCITSICLLFTSHPSTAPRFRPSDDLDLILSMVGPVPPPAKKPHTAPMEPADCRPLRRSGDSLSSLQVDLHDGLCVGTSAYSEALTLRNVGLDLDHSVA